MRLIENILIEIGKEPKPFLIGFVFGIIGVIVGTVLTRINF